jgi:sugar phosphate isomerase/epimerase
MKVGIFAALFSQRPFEEVLDYIKEAGCEAVEIGCRAYPGNADTLEEQ